MKVIEPLRASIYTVFAKVITDSQLTDVSKLLMYDLSTTKLLTEKFM